MGTPRHGLAATASIILLAAVAAAAGDGPDAAPSGDPHAHHRAQAVNPSVQVAQRRYEVPDITLTDEQGRAVSLRELMSEDRPLAVNFIFTSCTSICPVMTATMVQMQRALADDPGRPAFVSISIDPDFDSAEVLKAYAANQGADWTFLTGRHDEVVTVLRAFDAYRGNKMNHAALTLLRAPHATEWTRVEGLTSAHELARLWKRIAS